MASYDVYSGDQSVLSLKINSTQTTNIKIAAMNINGTLTAWANTLGVIEVSQQGDATLKREWIYYTGTSVDSTTKVATLSGVVRGISSTTSDVTSGSTGVAFSKGATVRFVTFHDLINKKANLDRASTITATWTFSTGGKIAFSGTDTEGLVLKSLTTTQRDALTPSNGAIIYNTTAGQIQFREGGAWVTNAAGGTVADASTTVAGKVEEATVAEVGASTAAGGTGARLFINPSAVVKTSSGAGDENKLPALNSSGQLAQGFVALTTKGDILTSDGSIIKRQAVGTDEYFLTADSSQTNGLRWTSMTGMISQYAARTAPTGYLLCNGAAVSRTTYANLFNTISPTVGTFTVTLASPAVFTLNSHGLLEGDTVYFTTTGALPTGLTANTIYYVIAAGLTANAFEVSASRGGAAVNTSVSQSGTHTAVYCPYGLGNGSTTFNVPDLRGRVPAGSDLMGTTAASRITTAISLSVTGGTADGAHSHTVPGSGNITDSGSGKFMLGSNPTTTSTTNILPPYLTVSYIIKT